MLTANNFAFLHGIIDRLLRLCTAPKAAPRETPDEIRKLLLIGSTAVFLLVGGLGSWAATANLAGAVVAQGTVVVDSSVKKVQHPTGGVVGEIRVRDGDRVAAGDIVMRLDETITRANLGVVTSQLDELYVRQARLKAERDGADTVELPKELAARSEDQEIVQILAGERTLFESRRTGRAGQKAQLIERINQLNEEIVGLEAQTLAKARELELVNTELAENLKLWQRNLTPLSKYIALQREAARITGERAQLVASTAQEKAKIAETRLQIIQLDQDLKTEVMKDLREAQAKTAELIERRVSAEDQLRRVDIRSPQSGIVHQLSVHTVGGVITPSEPIMLVVPDGDSLVVEAKIAPQDIDHVHLGQAAYIRFTAFNQRTTPEFNGTVIHVAADLTKDQQPQQASQSYFVARVGLTDAESKRFGRLKLVPGMPAEVFIRTGERTALSYLIKPMRDQITRAFTEQ
jgi:HlyD family secretion protein